MVKMSIVSMPRLTLKSEENGYKAEHQTANMSLNIINPNILVPLQNLMARMGLVCKTLDPIAVNLSNLPIIPHLSQKKRVYMIPL